MDKERKKELLLEYKERKVVGGVYIIENTVTGKVLLESAIDINGSKNKFDFSIQTNSCTSMRLQKDWKEYGAGSFEFKVLEEIEKKAEQTTKEFKEDVKTLEEMWLEKLTDKEFY